MGKKEIRKFQKEADEIASFLKSRLSGGSQIKINTDSDPDGVAAGNILARCLDRFDVPFHISFDGPPESEDLEKLRNQDYDLFTFIDQGTGQLELIKEHLLENDRDVLVMDHHPGEIIHHPNLVHINPHQFGLDGTNDVSASGVVYSVVEKIDKKFEPLSEMAIVGAVGDRQVYSSGFRGINKNIMNYALENDFIAEKEGLKLDGRTFPLKECLKYSVNPFLLGISGDEESVSELLEDLDLDPNSVLDELDQEQERKLRDELLERIETEPSKDFEKSLWGKIYTPKVKQAVGPRNIHEYVTMLDACEKFNKIDLGFSALLGNENYREDALETLRKYQKRMIEIMNWLVDNKDRIKTTDQMRHIDFGDVIETQMVGETLSIAIESGLVDIEKPLFGLAKGDSHIKVSARASSEYAEAEADIGTILSKVSKEISGSGGGHSVAAAARLPLERKDEFLRKTKHLLKEAAEKKE